MSETISSNSPKATDNLIEKRIGKKVSPDAPRVSVIIPAYNVAEYIAEALDSALAQTFKDYEIILVNDGSPDTDCLEKALLPYFERIVYLKQPNGGASAARNTAIEAARGSILAFLDGDDVWFAEKLAEQMAFFEAHDFDMIYCDALLFGEPLFEGRTFMQTAPSEGKVTPEKLLVGQCNVLTSGTIVLKEFVVKYGMFDLKAFRVEDFELWFRLCKNGVKIGYQEKVMLKYRIRAGSLTGNNIEKAERGVAGLKIIRDRSNLTESELKIWHKQMQAAEAKLSFEKGKHNLVSGNFADAKKDFVTANEFCRKPKLSAINFLMRLSPHLTLHLFKALRPSEFSFISPYKSVE
jgi:GT2 family glycosyltransferase